VIFRCFNGNAEEATRSRERREYLESIKRIGAPFGASIVNDGYSGRKRQLAGTRRGIHAVLDQQSENDRKQNGEKKPSFHGRECATGIRQVNSGSSAGPLPSSALRRVRPAEMRRSGRGSATGAFAAGGIHFDQ